MSVVPVVLTRIISAWRFEVCTTTYLHAPMRKCYETVRVLQCWALRKGEKHAPSGITGLQRKTSFTNAVTYGNLSMSAHVGTRSRPTIASMACCARFMTSGYRTMAKMKLSSVDAVWQRMSVPFCRKFVGTRSQFLIRLPYFTKNVRLGHQRNR